MKGPLVSVVIPTLNEELGIGATIDAIDRDAIKARAWRLEVLVVDGCSTDATVKEAKRRKARVIEEPRRGYGRAYKTGFAQAKGEIIVTGDADGTYPFDRLHEYVDLLMTEGLDFLTGDRYADLHEGSMSAKHRLGNWVLSATTRTLFGLKLRDSQSGFWVFHRRALEELPIDELSDGMAFSQEIKVEALRRLGDRAREVPASLRPRIGEPVIASWRDGLGNLRRLFAHRRRRLQDQAG